MNYGLPTTVEVDGVSWDIRSDYRAILDIIEALNDPELDPREKAFVALDIFYPDFEKMPQSALQAALEQCFGFIEMGERKSGNAPKVVDWEHDFPYIVAPINAVAGQEIRALPYLHWWTFIAYYGEISGECTFAQIIRIRDKKARGKSLDKTEREWYNRNRELVDIPQRYTEAEEELLKKWGGVIG